MKLLIADDHPLFRIGLIDLVREVDPSLSVIEANSWFELKQKAAADSVDVIITDLVMPDGEPITMLRQLIEDHPGTPVVVMSMFENLDIIKQALQLGAAGFIPKETDLPVIVEAIRLVAAGGKYFPPSLLSLLQTMPRGETAAHSSPTHLTRRQRAVLEEMAAGRSNKEIARSLGVTEATVKMHVSAILRVLDADSRLQGIVRARQLGLLEEEEHEGSSRTK